MHCTGMHTDASSALLEERLWGQWQEATSLPGGPAVPWPSCWGLAFCGQQGMGEGAAKAAPTLGRASALMP